MLLGGKKYQETHELAMARLKTNGRDADAVCALGLIACDHKNFSKGIELLSQSVALRPTDAHFHAQLARALTLTGRQADARITADQAASVQRASDDNRAFVNDMIGVVFSRVGLHARAVPFFERAIIADSKTANYRYNLAASQQFSGAFDAAKIAYEEAIRLDPDNYRAMSSLIALRRQTSETHQLDSLSDAYNRLCNDADAAHHIGHAIAKTLEDLGRFEESFDWLHKAKAKKAAEIDHKVAWDLDLINAAKSTTSQRQEGPPLDKAAPIFVTGLPRTGTTLVERILSSHRDAQSVGELNAFADGIKRLSAVQSPHVLDRMTFEAVTPKNLLSVGQDYMDFVTPLLAAIGAPTARSIDKMPLNILCAGLIHRALPNARIVVLRRGAMDSCLSNYRQLFSTGHSYYNYSFDLDQTAQYYRAFDALVAHWANTLPADRFMQVHYENIVFDQEAETRRLLEFCDLSWDERCLRFHENEAPVSTASSVQVRQPLYSGSIGRWTRFGDRVEGLRTALGALAEGSPL